MATDAELSPLRAITTLADFSTYQARQLELPWIEVDESGTLLSGAVELADYSIARVVDPKSTFIAGKEIVEALITAETTNPAMFEGGPTNAEDFRAWLRDVTPDLASEATDRDDADLVWSVRAVHSLTRAAIAIRSRTRGSALVPGLLIAELNHFYPWEPSEEDGLDENDV